MSAKLCAMCGLEPVVWIPGKIYGDFCSRCERRVKQRLDKDGLLRAVKEKQKAARRNARAII